MSIRNDELISQQKKLFALSYLTLIIWNIFLFYYSYKSTELQIYNLLLTSGIIFICEDSLDEIKISKKNYLKFISSLLITLLLIRGIYSISDRDPLSYLSLLVINFSFLLLIENPLLFKFSKQIIFLSFLMPLRFILKPLITTVFTQFTIKSTWLILNTLGYSSNIYDNNILFKNTGIKILEACSGSDQIIFCITLTIILMICYPLKSKLNIFLITIYSLAAGLIENSIRLAILAIFVKNNTIYSTNLFNFFHNSFGSLIFPLISTISIMMIYSNFFKKENMISN